MSSQPGSQPGSDDSDAGRPDADRTTQAERSARSRNALLESAAQGLSRVGYRNLVLDQVARDAGYSRGALYHQFRDKQALASAALQWSLDTWSQEVAVHVAAESDPAAALLTLARRHAVFCRRDIARMAVALRLEFAGQDHPLGREVEAAYELLIGLCVRLVKAGRRVGSIPPGAPARTLALAFIGAVEGTVMALAGQPRYDELLTSRAGAGVLGIASVPTHLTSRAETTT